MDTPTPYIVPDMSCDHCRVAIEEEVGRVAGVEAVRVDLESKRVAVSGEALDDGAIRAAIAAAGYEAVR